MTIYQKAIKVRKTCENIIDCVNGCPYFNQCTVKKLERFIPQNFKIEALAKAIKEEKWKVN